MTAIELQTIFAGILVLITAAYAWTTWRQFQAMRQALDETRRSNEATQKSNEIAERSLELGSRAWLVVSIRTVLERGNFAGFVIDISNVGKIPASDAVVWYRFDEWDPEIPDSILPREGQGRKRGIVVGNGETHSLIPPHQEREGLGKNDASKSVKTFYCEVTYLDFFQKPRKTVACWQYLPKVSVWAHQDWIYAPKHNRLE